MQHEPSGINWTADPLGEVLGHLGACGGQSESQDSCFCWLHLLQKRQRLGDGGGLGVGPYLSVLWSEAGAADRMPSYGDLEASWEPVGMV
jgi:hypothetical protein